MSLDVYLYLKQEETTKEHSGIFIRQNGQTVEISEKEWQERFPEKEPARISIPDVETIEPVFQSNITHNLGKMAQAAGIYYHLWRPEEIGITNASELIEPLKEGLKKLKENPEEYEKYSADNGWGTYKQFLPWIAEYLQACIDYPEAEIEVSR